MLAYRRMHRSKDTVHHARHRGSRPCGSQDRPLTTPDLVDRLRQRMLGHIFGMTVLGILMIVHQELGGHVRDFLVQKMASCSAGECPLD